MFNLPRSLQTEGETDETPIELNGDSMKDFEGLMSVLYPPWVSAAFAVRQLNQVVFWKTRDKYQYGYSLTLCVLQQNTSWMRNRPLS